MSNFVFLVGHPGSGAVHLYNSLTSSPAVAGTKDPGESNFTLVSQLDNLAVAGRINKPMSRRWLYLLADNSYVAKHLYPCCQFVIVVREPNAAISAAIAAGDNDPMTLATRYCSRLLRLCEMARDAPGALLATHESIADGSALRGLREKLGVGYCSNSYRDDNPQRIKDSGPLATCRLMYAKCLDYLGRHCRQANAVS